MILFCFTAKNEEIESKRAELDSLAEEKEEATTEVTRLKREWAALKKRSEEEVEAVERLRKAKEKVESEWHNVKRQAQDAKKEVKIRHMLFHGIVL